MGTLLILILVAVAGWVIWKLYKKPDLNNDGKVDAQDVLVAAKEVATEVKAEATEVVEKVKKARKKKA
jgi:hypothetical protein